MLINVLHHINDICVGVMSDDRARQIYHLILTCKDRLSDIKDYKATAELDETLAKTWTGLISKIEKFLGEFLLFSRSLTSCIQVEALQEHLKSILALERVSDHAMSVDVNFVMEKLRMCLQCLNSLYYKLEPETPSVRDQYVLLRDVDFIEEKYEKKKMDEREKDVINRIDLILTKVDNDDLKNNFERLKTVFIEEMDRRSLLSSMKSDLHFMKEENLEETIQRQNLEISRLKEELENTWWNSFNKWRNRKKTVDMDELLYRLEQL